jgi:hypothetical protein
MPPQITAGKTSKGKAAPKSNAPKGLKGEINSKTLTDGMAGEDDAVKVSDSSKSGTKSTATEFTPPLFEGNRAGYEFEYTAAIGHYTRPDMDFKLSAGTHVNTEAMRVGREKDGAVTFKIPVSDGPTSFVIRADTKWLNNKGEVWFKPHNEKAIKVTPQYFNDNKYGRSINVTRPPEAGEKPGDFVIRLRDPNFQVQTEIVEPKRKKPTLKDKEPEDMANNENLNALSKQEAAKMYANIQAMLSRSVGTIKSRARLENSPAFNEYNKGLKKLAENSLELSKASPDLEKLQALKANVISLKFVATQGENNALDKGEKAYLSGGAINLNSVSKQIDSIVEKLEALKDASKETAPEAKPSEGKKPEGQSMTPPPGGISPEALSGIIPSSIANQQAASADYGYGGSSLNTKLNPGSKIQI